MILPLKNVLKNLKSSWMLLLNRSYVVVINNKIKIISFLNKHIACPTGIDIIIFLYTTRKFITPHVWTDPMTT